jgi:hypothetical protein
LHATAAAVVSELLVSDMAHACVETFHHSQIIVIVHCGPSRNRVALDNSASIGKKKISIFLTREFAT